MDLEVKEIELKRALLKARTALETIHHTSSFIPIVDIMQLCEAVIDEINRILDLTGEINHRSKHKSSLFTD